MSRCSNRAALNSLCRTLAAEEPELTAVALRPGVVDTPMQAELIKEGRFRSITCLNQRMKRRLRNPFVTCSQRTDVRQGLVSCISHTSFDRKLQKKLITLNRSHSQRFVDIHAQKKLVPPAYSGHVLAALAVKADKELSGQFVNYSDESMSAYQPS